jgi:hypothetical protein
MCLDAHSRAIFMGRKIFVLGLLAAALLSFPAAAEAELTSAAYGTPDARGKIRGTTRTANVRLLLATYYFV